MLGSDIVAVEKPEALSLIAKSDFVILTTLPKTSVYPFAREIAKYWAELKTWAGANMILARTVSFDGFALSVYARPSATISDLSSSWISSKGFSIEAERSTLQQFPIVQLFGPANYAWLPKVPTASATIETGKAPLAVPASLRRTDAGYEIRIDTPTTELPSSDLVCFHVTFDTFFIPKKLGINDDTSELVFQAPTVIRLLRREP
jgi:hypothetical protein